MKQKIFYAINVCHQAKIRTLLELSCDNKDGSLYVKSNCKVADGSGVKYNFSRHYNGIVNVKQGNQSCFDKHFMQKHPEVFSIKFFLRISQLEKLPIAISDGYVIDVDSSMQNFDFENDSILECFLNFSYESDVKYGQHLLTLPSRQKDVLVADSKSLSMRSFNFFESHLHIYSNIIANVPDAEMHNIVPNDVFLMVQGYQQIDEEVFQILKNATPALYAGGQFFYNEDGLCTIVHNQPMRIAPKLEANLKDGYVIQLSCSDERFSQFYVKDAAGKKLQDLALIEKILANSKTWLDARL